MDRFRSEYKKNGFFLLKDFFNKSKIEEILNDAKNIFLNQIIEKKYISNCKLEDLKESEFNDYLYKLFTDFPDIISNCGKQIQHLISLHRLSLDKEIITVLKDLGIKFPNISTRPVLYFNHPKLAKKKVYHTVEAHQDWRSMQGSLNSIVIWVPLVDVDKDLGALKVLPGSHLKGLKTDEIIDGFGMVNVTREEKEKFKSIEVNSGDILIFSSFLVHESGINTTDSPRWSCHFRYNDLDEKTFIERNYPHSYIYKPIEDLITGNFPSKELISNIFS
jgi:phytanoyl-CoA hydroxylase